ncbi:hypothetical protein CO666_21745 [Rhizobium chutanense]|uniref:Uncharacterized protein n=1 Tax=Rhizobium chutanense TaxID=2035448 RepID=A0A2A6J8J5_9HYPH|nr:hypothetical protein CO666_21745 [Rhizobium chutanense]
MNVVGKTGIPGPLIRPTGTFSPRGEEGIETLRHIPFAPLTGVRRTVPAGARGCHRQSPGPR